MTLAKPTAKERISYGWCVMGQAAGVLLARVRSLAASAPSARRAQPANVMFNAALPPMLDAERSELERFDLYIVRRHEFAQASRADRVRVWHATARD
jgi:hypothetical protein